MNQVQKNYIIIKFIKKILSKSLNLNVAKRQKLLRDMSRLLDSLTISEKRDILHTISRREDVPLSTFGTPLSSLEVIVKYLKEDANKSINEISQLLNRTTPTIYATYRNSKVKFKKRLPIDERSILVPLEVFKDRKFSILESLVAHLRENQKLSLREISRHLNNSIHTSKTVYQRFKKKRGVM